MKNTTQKLGAMTLFLILSVLVTQPANADHRRDYQQNRHRDHHQPYDQSYYNHQYQKYQDRRYAGRRYDSHGRGHGHQYNNGRHYNKHYAQYNGYDSYYSGRPRNQHHHRHGIVVLRGPAYGYSHCEAHGGYYRSGDIYY
jgi:hypothetical protein